MRLLGKDAGAGFIDVQVDTLDDLWTLRNLIQPGDQVTADTWRTAELPGDKLRAERAEKRPMRLGVRVEQVEWHDFDDHLRVLGTIVSGPQDLGRHHTLVFRDEPGTRLRLVKAAGLEPWHLRSVQEAQEATSRPRVVLLAIDDAEAQFATLTSYGVQMLGSLPAGGLGKREDTSARAKRQFYDDVARALAAHRSDTQTPLLVVGPGWWREEFLDHLRQKAPEQAQGARTDGTAHGGRLGIHEALRRGMLEVVARDHRVGQDTMLVEDLLARIARDDGLAAYGPEDVARAVAAGAAETLVVTDEAVRGARHDRLLRDAEAARARVHIVSTGHQAGAQLERMGGLAALLRFRPG